MALTWALFWCRMTPHGIALVHGLKSLSVALLRRTCMASATSSTSHLEAKPEKIKPGDRCNFLSARKGRRPIAEVMDMKKGETAVLTSMSPLLCKDLSLSHGCLWGKGRLLRSHSLAWSRLQQTRLQAVTSVYGPCNELVPVWKFWILGGGSNFGALRLRQGEGPNLV